MSYHKLYGIARFILQVFGITVLMFMVIFIQRVSAPPKFTF